MPRIAASLQPFIAKPLQLNCSPVQFDLGVKLETVQTHALFRFPCLVNVVGLIDEQR